jgi:hypothetical protein
MKKLIKAIRLLLFILMMVAAAFGVGLTGHFLPAHRDPYRNAEIKTEQIDKKRKEDDAESENEKQ